MTVSNITKQMQAMLPQWMKMAKDPNSNGAKFLDVFGLEFKDLEDYLDKILTDQYIGTADVGQVDVIYKIPAALPVILNIEELGLVHLQTDTEVLSLPVMSTLRRFYSNDRHVAILDKAEGYVYVRLMPDYLDEADIYKPFNYMDIQGTIHYEYSLHHVWNPFDEFGLLLGVERLFGERNAGYKERILDVFRKPGNSTREGLTNAISRELGVENADIEVNEFASYAFRESLLDETGRPTRQFMDYVQRVNDVFGFTWDNMAWGEAYWRSVEESNIGIDYLPHIWDPSMEGWRMTDFQSGIGDGDDLKVEAPREEPNRRKFKYKVGLRGRNSGLERMDPEISFKYKIVAKGKILDQEYRPEVYRYTVVASEVIKLNYLIRATKDYYYKTVVDFNPSTSGYQFDDPSNPSIEIVKGTTNLSQTNPSKAFYRVNTYFSTRSKTDTPMISEFVIKWRDTAGTKHDFTLTSQEDFTRNDAYVDTDFIDMLATVDGKLELGYGDFYYMMDTYGSLREGTHTQTVEIKRSGSIHLNLPKK